MLGGEKPLHDLPRFSMDKLVMQEVAYHISTWLPKILHRRKKAPWPTLPLWIGLYGICILKDVNVEAKVFRKFGFSTKSFNLYDPHYI